MRVPAELHVYVANFDPFHDVKCGNTTRAADKTCGLGETVVLTL